MRLRMVREGLAVVVALALTAAAADEIDESLSEGAAECLEDEAAPACARPVNEEVGPQAYGGLNLFRIGNSLFGMQLGLVNHANAAAVYGLQLGLLDSAVASSGAGLQLALATALDNSSFGGGQLGLWNAVKGDSKLWGWQIGLDNVNGGSVYGCQVGAFGRGAGTRSAVYGLSVAALGSMDDDLSVYGLSLGGILNAAREHYGFQFGFINRVRTLGGVQVGVFNAQMGDAVSSGQATGVQLGVVNCATRLTGIQLGLFNSAGNAAVKLLPIVNMAF